VTSRALGFGFLRQRRSRRYESKGMLHRRQVPSRGQPRSVAAAGLMMRAPPWFSARQRRLSRPLRRSVSPMPSPSSITSRIRLAESAVSVSMAWVAWAWRATLVRASRVTATSSSITASGTTASIGPLKRTSGSNGISVETWATTSSSSARTVLPIGATALFLPYDQGLEHGPRDFFANPAASDPRYIVRLAQEGGFNGIVTQIGLAEKFYWDYAGEVPLVLKLNGKTEIPSDAQALSPINATVEDAVRLGADTVGYTLYVGTSAGPRHPPVPRGKGGRATGRNAADRVGVPTWLGDRE
jgi:DeoC/LacD family aldolase